MNDDPRHFRPRRNPASTLNYLVVGSALWAVPFALFFGTLFGAGLASYLLCLKISLVFSFMIRAALLVVETFVAPRLQNPDGEDRFHWASAGAAYMAGAIVGSYAAAILVDLFVWHEFLAGPRSWIMSGLFTVVFSVMFAGIGYAQRYYRQSVARAAQVERIRGELARAELRTLRAQINPHFLFNTLNTIAALIAEDPHAAEDVVTRLADVFRYALTSAQREHSRFGDELEFLRSYLEIERTRLGERLGLEERIEPGLENVPVPSLLLQPLVENAVRYAIAARSGGGRITLAARRAGESLVIEIADDGPGFVPGTPAQGHGVGLESVRERLRLAGPGHDFRIQSEPGTGTRVTLTLPLVPAAAPSPAPPITENPPCRNT